MLGTVEHAQRGGQISKERSKQSVSKVHAAEEENAPQTGVFAKPPPESQRQKTHCGAGTSPRLVRVAAHDQLDELDAMGGARRMALATLSTRWQADMVGRTLNLPPCRSVHVYSERTAWVIYRASGGDLVGIDGASHDLSRRIRKVCKP